MGFSFALLCFFFITIIIFRVVAVSDSEKLINLTDNQKTEKVLPKDIQVNQRKMFSYLHDDFLKKKAIEMGKIEVVVMVKLLEGRKYLINSDGNLENEKIVREKKFFTEKKKGGRGQSHLLMHSYLSHCSGLLQQPLGLCKQSSRISATILTVKNASP